MKLGEAHIIQGNALNLPLDDSSVDLICTSPPYFGLRSYQDGGAHYDGQIGSEATPTGFLDALIAATAEMVRVLKPSGSIFVNLGDKYADKGLMGMPWRYAIACIDQLGLILRAEIIWAKPNGLPESVTDRVRRSHEQWFHFTRSPRYFSAVDEIREPQDTIGEKHGSSKGQRALTLGFTDQPRELNPLGKLPGSVWTIPTQPLTVPPELGIDHFAAYPMEWPRRIIQGWTPNGICLECGEGRRPIAAAERTSNEALRPEYGLDVNGSRRVGGQWSTLGPRNVVATITGYNCACPPFTFNCDHPRAGYYREYRTDRILCSEDGCNLGDIPDTTPAVVLDPFGGTGTTALVAKALGRTGITIDLSRDYCRIAEWRCSNPGELATALGIEKPEPISPDQLELFG